jgi:hypothetical protein
MKLVMKRVAHKSRSAQEAKAWEIAQYRRMTPAQRVQIARTLKRRAYPVPQPDVRQCHRRVYRKIRSRGGLR